MSGRLIVTPPTLEPVTLGEVHDHLNLTSTVHDGLLVGFILEAREQLERETQRAFLRQRWSRTIDWNWPTAWDGSCRRQRIVLPLPPLLQVISIAYVDANGNSQTLAADQYRVSKGDIFGSIDPAFGVAWPAVRGQTDTINVTFECGYGDNPGDVPGPLRAAIRLLAAHLWENREAVNVGNIVTEMPLGVERLISRYVTGGWL